jgi:rfaE bifunctional protein kinase chain/domain
LLPENNVENILENMRGMRVLVAGDLILDHYLCGRVERISPEAPVPIVSLEAAGERWVPGGAANVARNVSSLGGIPVMAGVRGDDPEGAMLEDLLADSGVDVSGIVTDPDRPTTSKTRIMSGGHQLIRLDSETTNEIDGEVCTRLLDHILASIASVDAVILQDYNKGVLHPALTAGVLSRARAAGIPVAVDPKFEHFFSFTGCTLFKPNRLETARVLGRRISTVEEASDAGVELLHRLSAGAVLITLGEQGSVLVRDGHPPFHTPTAARHVFDVSGAGDTVIAVMGLGLASGLPLEDSVRLSNFAAAATCAEPGVYSVRPEDIIREVVRHAAEEGADLG